MKAHGFELDAYRLMLCDPFYMEWKPAQYAEFLNVKTTKIYAWNRDIDWEEIKIARRKGFAKLVGQVDNALYKASIKGDIQAIRTWYERFDDWTPASRILTEHSISEEDIDRELNDLIERKRAACEVIKSSGVDGEGQREIEVIGGGEGKTEAGRGDPLLPSQSSPAEVH